MKKSYHRFILIAGLSLCFTLIYGQKLKYDILLMGSKIGETIVEIRDSAGLKHYRLRSNSDAKMLFIEKKSLMSTDAIYNADGKMLFSYFENIKNDETLRTKAVWDDNKLTVVKDGIKTILNDEVSLSSLILFFSEPKDHAKFFSERLGQFFEIIKQPDSTYMVTLDGHSAIYTYKGGILSELEMKGSIGSVTMKLLK